MRVCMHAHMHVCVHTHVSTCSCMYACVCDFLSVKAMSATQTGVGTGNSMGYYYRLTLLCRPEWWEFPSGSMWTPWPSERCPHLWTATKTKPFHVTIDTNSFWAGQESKHNGSIWHHIITTLMLQPFTKCISCPAHYPKEEFTTHIFDVMVVVVAFSSLARIFGRMFDHSFPTCPFYFILFFECGV